MDQQSSHQHDSVKKTVRKIKRRALKIETEMSVELEVKQEVAKKEDAVIEDKGEVVPTEAHNPD